jgi:filamentous hemagglutinin
MATRRAGRAIAFTCALACSAGNGSTTTWTNTRLDAGAVSLSSGGDMTLKGAVVSGHSVQAQVGCNLTIQSLQDSSSYAERQKSAGGSVTVGPAPGGSVSAGRTSIDSTYKSVTEQSGLRAGDGGFTVSVQGKTNPVGGAITSTQAALDAGANSFASAGGTTYTDLQNSASFSARSSGVSICTTANAGVVK